jgi:DNA repair photolyase
MNMDTIKEIDVKSVMTKSSLPVGGYSVNPYVGCPHACRYCYASFMKRFTGHTEPWGTFLDVKNWKPITNPHKYDGERVVIGSVTDGYNPYEEEFHRTRRLLEELRGSDAEIMICTKSDVLVYGSIDVKIHAAACLVERYADQSIRVDYLVHILVVFAKIIISFIKMA